MLMHDHLVLSLGWTSMKARRNLRHGNGGSSQLQGKWGVYTAVLEQGAIVSSQLPITAGKKKFGEIGIIYFPRTSKVTT